MKNNNSLILFGLLFLLSLGFISYPVSVNALDNQYISTNIKINSNFEENSISDIKSIEIKKNEEIDIDKMLADAKKKIQVIMNQIKKKVNEIKKMIEDSKKK